MTSSFNKKSDSVLVKIILSAIISIIILIAFIMFAAFIISSSERFYDSLFIFWYIISGLTALLTGFIAGRFLKRRGILWGSVSGLIISVIVIFILSCFSGFNINPYIFFLIPCGVVPGAAGGIFATNIN